jgi:hypothetical protein
MRCKALGLVPMQVLTPTTKDPTVTLAVLALTLGALAGTASAANGSCMTQREFSALHKGQTLTRVAAIVGSRGHVEASSTAGSYNASVRSWKTCTPYGAASATFMNGRLTAKAGVFS